MSVPGSRPKPPWPVFRAIVPMTGLALFGLFVFLWVGGFHSAYYRAVGFFGITPFKLFPFLDSYGLLSAAQCYRHGIDIYVQNPCDILKRTHDYSPLWLPLIPRFIGVRDNLWFGAALDVSFLVSLAALFRPHSGREALIGVAAALSPVTVYALERANVDLLMFILILGASLIGTASRRRRVLSLGLVLIAGLLKYYPLVLLAFIARERWRTACVLAFCFAAVLLLFGACYSAEISQTLAHVPSRDYLGVNFSALNLPFGLVAPLPNLSSHTRTIIGLALLGILVVAMIVRVWLMAGLLYPRLADWTSVELRCLATASLLVPACFFAGQNNAYRAVLLLLAVPGLVHLWRTIDDAALRRRLGRIVFAVVFVLWEPLFRHLELTIPARGSVSFVLRFGYWIGRELIWWWLIVGLSALALSYFLGLPLTRELWGKLRRLRAVPAR